MDFENAGKMALVTGANSGIGHETAAQFAQARYKKVFVGARSEEKAKDAIARLKDRTGTDCFSPAVMDVADLDSIKAGIECLFQAIVAVTVLR